MPRKFVIEWSTALRKGRGRSSAKVLEGIAADLYYRWSKEFLEAGQNYPMSALRACTTRRRDELPRVRRLTGVGVFWVPKRDRGSICLGREGEWKARVD